MNGEDVACSSNDNRNKPDDDEDKRKNSEKHQQDPELRKKFEEKWCVRIITTKDEDGIIVKKVSFEMMKMMESKSEQSIESKLII
jgi:hypothetical protein